MSVCFCPVDQGSFFAVRSLSPIPCWADRYATLLVRSGKDGLGEKTRAVSFSGDLRCVVVSTASRTQATGTRQVTPRTPRAPFLIHAQTEASALQLSSCSTRETTDQPHDSRVLDRRSWVTIQHSPQQREIPTRRLRGHRSGVRSFFSFLFPRFLRCLRPPQPACACTKIRRLRLPPQFGQEISGVLSLLSSDKESERSLQS